MSTAGGPPASDKAALHRMRSQKGRETWPELRLRRELWSRGLRYRIDAKLPVAGRRRRADILFSRARIAVFVDGCYWHACPLHGTSPKANASWWAEKLAANVRRDRDTDAQLAARGWRSVRVWEHENVADAADRIEALVRDGPRDEPPKDGVGNVSRRVCRP